MSKSLLLSRSISALLTCAVATSLPLLSAQASPLASERAPGGTQIIEPGQPPVQVHATVERMEKYRAANGSGKRPGSGSKELAYQGGTGGIGVETAPKVYLVLWGNQWANDPSGEAAILESFFNNVGGSSWLNSVTQYCQGVPKGTITCGSSGQAAGNQAGILAGIWPDNSAPAPSQPTQSQLANEAIRAAQQFGNTTSTSNQTVQYVIATSHGNSSSGFGVQYCAWHSSTGSTYGNIAYTNLPYITDAGASCGANFNGLGPNAGITIVEGHELAETITDQYPSSGWIDSGGAENGDKCAWISSGQGAAANVTFTSAGSTYTFPVQSLWSNAYNNGAGGCVLSY